MTFGLGLPEVPISFYILLLSLELECKERLVVNVEFVMNEYLPYGGNQINKRLSIRHVLERNSRSVRIYI